MHCRTLAMITVVLTGCSSSASDTAPAPEAVDRVSISGWGGAEMHTQPGLGSRHLDAPINSVWLILPKVYEHLEIPNAGANPETMTFGNPGYRARRIEGKRLSSYMNCGMGATAVPNADSYDVTASILTRVTPAEEGGTLVVTSLDASARPRAVTGNPVHCQSNGVLEARIAELVLWELVRGQA